MLPAKADRTEKQNALVDQYYAEYAALGLDEYEIENLIDKVCANNKITYLDAACRVAALERLEAETFEFEPACCE